MDKSHCSEGLSPSFVTPGLTLESRIALLSRLDSSFVALEWLIFLLIGLIFVWVPVTIVSDWALCDLRG
jgi:hypothetical protein